jgi:hypothetical protein
MEETDEAAPAADTLPGAGNGALPDATGADPTPNTASRPVDVQTPPGLEHAASPSKIAQASFASAATGVADDTNAEGKVVLNGA